MKRLVRTLTVLGLLLTAMAPSLLGEVQTPPCRAALLVIDVQKAWVGSYALTIDQVPVQDKIAGIAESARLAGMTVVFVVDVGHRDQFTDEELELVEPLAVLDGDLLVEKNYQNGFIGTSLKDDLRELGITTLLITGYASHECVAKTVGGARVMGFEAIIIADAHSGGLGGSRARQQNEYWEGIGLQVIQSTELDFAAFCSTPAAEDGT